MPYLFPIKRRQRMTKLEFQKRFDKLLDSATTEVRADMLRLLLGDHLNIEKEDNYNLPRAVLYSLLNRVAINRQPDNQKYKTLSKKILKKIEEVSEPETNTV